MRRQNFGHQRLKFFHHGVVNFAAFFFGQGLLQRSALVHRCRGNYAAIIGHLFQSSQFSRGKFHCGSSK